MADRHERALEAARRLGADAVLAANVSTVTWLTGFEAAVSAGPSPWAHTPLALLPQGGPRVLIVAEDDAEAATSLGCELVTYPGYGIGRLDPVGHVARVLTALVDGRTVATEPGSLPAVLATDLSFVDATAELGRARAVKDPDELGRIRAAVRVADAGQRAVRECVRPGRTELEVWAEVRAAMEAEVGGPVSTVVADLVCHPGLERFEGPPTDRALAEGHLLITDLAPRRAGYWADSCSTISIGEATASARKMHAVVRGRLERAIDAVRPGVVAGDLDALVREGLNYPHHSGHGIGTTYHEEPRIVPGWPTALEPGMVMALEPGLYGEGEGVRLEWVVVVTPEGSDVLSAHDLSL
jgi:Xaa-Pro dipeptidase